MSNPQWVKGLQNFWHALVHDSQKEIIDDIQPVITFLSTKGGPAVIALAVNVISGNAVGAAWADLISQLIPVAKAAGIELLEDEAAIVLNLAKANLLAKAV